MSHDSVRIGIAGLGRLGKRHADNLANKIKGCELVAASSVVQEELDYARASLGISHTYNDFSEMLDDDAIDAVFLVTPTSLHAEQIEQSLSAGKHVFCEKPLALNADDCARVVELAKNYPDRIATIGFVRRYDPSHVYAKEKIDSGAIGQPILLRTQTVDMDAFAEFQVPFTATSGGFAHDMLVHDIDLARWFLGSEMTTAYAIGGCYKHKGFEQYQDIDNASALCQYDNGACAYYFASRTAQHGHDTRCEIVGTEGILKIGQTPSINRVEICDMHGARQECVEDFYARFEDAFLLEAQDYVTAILEKRKPRCDLNDAMQATRGAIAITEAYRGGELVRL